MKRTRSTASLTELQPKEPQPKPKKLNTSIVGGSDAVGLRIPQSASHRVTVDFDDFIDKEFIDTKLATYVIWDRHGNKFTYLGQRFTRLKVSIGPHNTVVSDSAWQAHSLRACYICA